MENILYVNYESTKLVVNSPNLINAVILLVFILLFFLSLRKKSGVLLDRMQTDQIKGIAILLIVVGHLWAHVSLGRATPMLSAPAVSLFLLLSGFGLTCSWDKKPTAFKEFIFRRLSKVMIPYWIITPIILLLDYVLLSRSYSCTDLLLTFMGINITETVIHIDYVRWYITLIIIYYLVFYVANSRFSRRYSIVVIFLFALAIFIFGFVTKIFLGQFHQQIAFPVGCLIAQKYEWLSMKLDKNIAIIKLILLLSLALIVLSLLNSNALFSSVTDVKLIKYGLTQLSGMSCYFMILLLFIFVGTKVASVVFSYLGKISFEIYLIHGAMLIKYNPVFHYASPDWLLLTFFIYLNIVVLFAFIFNRILQYCSNIDLRYIFKNHRGDL